MFARQQLLWSAIGLALAQPFLISSAHAQQSRQVPAYDKAQTRTVLDRSVFYLPLFGAVYRDKFTALIPAIPQCVDSSSTTMAVAACGDGKPRWRSSTIEKGLRSSRQSL
jgi:hypothetical protein